MIPHEKAKELYYYYETFFEIDDNFKKSKIKKCALIAVDEIINELSEFDLAVLDYTVIYWNVVKQEIEKL